MKLQRSSSPAWPLFLVLLQANLAHLYVEQWPMFMHSVSADVVSQASSTSSKLPFGDIAVSELIGRAIAARSYVIRPTTRRRRFFSCSCCRRFLDNTGKFLLEESTVIEKEARAAPLRPPRNCHTSQGDVFLGNIFQSFGTLIMNAMQVSVVAVGCSARAEPSYRPNMCCSLMPLRR